MMKQGAYFWAKGVQSFRSLLGRYRRAARNKPLRVALVFVLPLFGAMAATFLQIDWGGGVPADTTACSSAGGTWTGTECIAVDPTNQTGWTAYSSKDATVTVASGGADLQLGTVIDSRTQTSDSDFLLTKNLSRTHDLDSDFSHGAALSGVLIRGGTVRLGFATHTPSWAANAAWKTPSLGLYSLGAGTSNSVKPALADLDGDGDIDMLVGAGNGLTYAYKNTGDATAPTWVANGAWDVPSVGYQSSPAIGDLDGDGDPDLMIGEYGGGVYAFENTGTKYSPVWTAKAAWNIPDTALGLYAKPTLADLDGDGDLDLMVGDSGGISYAFRNDGTTAAPIWVANSAWDTPDTGADPRRPPRLRRPRRSR